MPATEARARLPHRYRRPGLGARPGAARRGGEARRRGHLEAGDPRFTTDFRRVLASLLERAPDSDPEVLAGADQRRDVV
jgi:hypothetical protein